ncbi:unnamed protein product [marine sediment metagenome]|uniref:Uncharacterized protein n=1 Tax=marine sediment metagenome TaxID=412755 RepID=X1KTX9_9ZZZZ
MSGIGTTLLEAVNMNRNCVAVEFEKKFVDWTNENVKLLNKNKTIDKRGSGTVLHGDARDLTNILNKQADKIVFSPPFASSPRAGNKDKDEFWKNQEQRHNRKFTKSKKILDSMHYSDNPDNIGNLPKGDIDTVVMSPPYAEIGMSDRSQCFEKPPRPQDIRQSPRKTPIRHYSKNKDNIGNLPVLALVALLCDAAASICL